MFRAANREAVERSTERYRQHRRPDLNSDRYQWYN
jgi:hypothetical protein